MSSPLAFLRFTAAVVLFAACGKDPARPPAFSLERIIVLNGQAPTGVSVLGDTGGVQAHIAFSDFDGASFSLRNDTVASAASKWSGDLLYVAALANGTVKKVQLPASSNPAGVAFGGPTVPGPTGGTGTVLYVALRDSSSVARVFFRGSGGEPLVETLTGAGVCPVDVLVSTSAVWALDANQRCTSDYATLGPSRMVPIPSLGSADTINFPASVVGAQRGFVIGDFAYVMAAGDYSISSMSATVTKVNLLTRETTVLELPDGMYGVSFRIGENGFGYVTAAPATPAFTPRVYAVNLSTMRFGGTRALPENHLLLTMPGGERPLCFVATADTSNKVYCLTNANAVSTLRVFDPAGNEIRSAAAGGLAFDLTLR